VTDPGQYARELRERAHGPHDDQATAGAVGLAAETIRYLGYAITHDGVNRARHRLWLRPARCPRAMRGEIGGKGGAVLRPAPTAQVLICTSCLLATQHAH
jgi:hypothetical protein